MRLVPSWSGSKRPEAFGTVLERIKTPCSVWFRHGAVQTGDMYRLKMVENVYVRFKTPWSVWNHHGADQNALKRLVPSCSGTKRDSNLLRADRTVHQHLIHNLTWMRLEPHFKTIGLFIFIDRNQLLDCERRERRVCGLKVLSKKCKVWPQPTVNIYEFEKILWKKAAIEHAIIR